MGLTPNVVPDAPILSAWGNEIRNRTVQVFATVAERALAWPSPPEGAVSYIVFSKTIEQFNGTAWVWAGGEKIGAWTPNWQGPSTVVTGVTSQGTYLRVGDHVTLHGRMTHGVGSNTGTALQMGGFPWRIRPSGLTLPVHGYGHFWHSPTRFPLMALGAEGNSHVDLQAYGNFGTAGSIFHTNVGAIGGGIPFAWGNGDEANVTISYITDQPF